MKKLHLFLAIAAVAVGLTACEDDQTGPVLQSPAKGSFNIPVPAYAATGITLDADSLLTISFPEQPDYGFNAAVDYTLNLSLDPSGENGKVINPESTTATSITVKEYNMAFTICELLGINKPTAWVDVPRNVYVSVNAQLGDISSTAVTSNVIELKDVRSFYAAAAYYLWTPGNSNGWSQSASQTLFSKDNVTFTGYAHLNGEFKFTSQPDWAGINYGSTGTEGTLSTDGGAGNLNAPHDGLYYVTVNTQKLTYKLDYIEHVSVIGDATPGGWEADTQLKPSADFLVWSADVALKSGGFKYRLNNSWDMNFGGDLNALSPNGDNIGWDTNGTFTIAIDFSHDPVTGSVTSPAE